MKAIWADDGSEFTADNYVDLVTLLREDCRTDYDNNFLYMKDFARRAVITENLDIRFVNEEMFIKDVAECGLIVLI